MFREDVMAKAVEFFYKDMVNSRMLEIRDYVGDGCGLPAPRPRVDNLCGVCRRFAILLVDCHLCGGHFCGRCVWYFLLPARFYGKKRAKNRILPPLTVCWDCHDKCINRRKTIHRGEEYVGQRKHLVLKKIKETVCFFPPKKISEEDFSRHKVCVICDRNECPNICNLCGDWVCFLCSVPIFAIPKAFRPHKRFAVACNECNFKLFRHFSVATRYLAAVSLREKLLERNQRANLVLASTELVKMEIFSVFWDAQKLQRALEAPPASPAPAACFLCAAAAPLCAGLAECAVCANLVCGLCQREFYAPKEPAAAQEPSGSVLSGPQYGDSFVAPAAVCWACHGLALTVRQLFYPAVEPLRQRRRRRAGGAGRALCALSALESGAEEGGESDYSAAPCFFCAVAREAAEEGVLRRCGICGELFCLRDSHMMAVGVGCGERAVVACLECRHCIVAEGFRVVFAEDEGFVEFGEN